MTTPAEDSWFFSEGYLRSVHVEPSEPLGPVEPLTGIRMDPDDVVEVES